MKTIDEQLAELDWARTRNAVRKRLISRISPADLDDAVQDALCMIVAIMEGALPITESQLNAIERYGAGLLIVHASKRVAAGWSHNRLDAPARYERWEYVDVDPDTGCVSPLSRSAHYAAKYGA